MLFSLTFIIDTTIVEVYNNKNVELLRQNLVDVALKSGWYIGQAKRHDLILEVVILSLEGHILFIIFSDLYSIIGIDSIKLCETLSPT